MGGDRVARPSTTSLGTGSPTASVVVPISVGSGGDVSAVKIIVVPVNVILAVSDSDKDVDETASDEAKPVSRVPAVAVLDGGVFELRHSTTSLSLAAIALLRDPLARVMRRVTLALGPLQ